MLLIEDDHKLAAHTAEYLRDHGAAVTIVDNGPAGLHAALEGEFDIALLDIMLPGLDGFALCRALRQNSQLPVIMLSARGEEADRVVGLEIGADDYLTKPFSPRELLARIRANLRREGKPAPREVSHLEVGPLRIDRARRTAVVHGHTCSLTAYQFDLLWALAEAGETVSSRPALYARVRALRGEPLDDFDPTIDRSIDVHLSKIRQALTACHPAGANLIRTMRGVGYVLAAESE